MSVPAWLTALGIPEHCISNRTSVAERRRTFTIQPAEGEELWCVGVDGCWLPGSETGKRVDYLFWGRSAAGKRVVFLVELKGSDYGHALEQIEATLGGLCKNSPHDRVHTGAHRDSPGHDPVRRAGGVRADVVLRSGRGLELQQARARRIQKQYGVIVYPHARSLSAVGLDGLLARRQVRR